MKTIIFLAIAGLFVYLAINGQDTTSRVLFGAAAGFFAIAALR